MKIQTKIFPKMGVKVIGCHENGKYISNDAKIAINLQDYSHS